MRRKCILGYVGKRDGTLGKFIIDRRTHNDLKATIVAHSMGCLLTYYQCNNSEIPFRQIVDNIVLTAPPFFGSSAANSANFPIVNWLTPFLKEHPELISNCFQELQSMFGIDIKILLFLINQ